MQRKSINQRYVYQYSYAQGQVVDLGYMQRKEKRIILTLHPSAS